MVFRRVRPEKRFFALRAAAAAPSAGVCRGERFTATIVAMNRFSALGWIAAGFAAGLIVGCDNAAPPKNRSEARERQIVAPPVEPPRYQFAAHLEARQPEVSAFVRHFMETCLAGDYSGYRKLVSRGAEPESKERFQAVYHAIRSVTIESIEPIEYRDIPQPAYLVINAVDLHADRPVAIRGVNRRFAIVVFREESEWRMVPAPSDLQPPDDAEATTRPATTAAPPDYPWDEDGDY